MLTTKGSLHGHVVPDLKIEIDTHADYGKLTEDIEHALQAIENIVQFITKEEKQKYFEFLCIGIPNHLNVVRVLLDQMSIKYHEELLNVNPHDANIKRTLNDLRKRFLETAKHAGLLD